MKDQIIDKISKIVSNSPLDESRISHLMSLIRKRIEYMDRQDKESYNILRFYCDWSAHIKLDRSEPALLTLKNINNMINEFKNDSILNEKISEAISINKLYAELALFFSNYNLTVRDIMNKQGWSYFVNTLMDIIQDCPLKFPRKIEKSARRIYEEIKGTPIKDGMWVIELSIRDKKYVESIIKDIPPGISNYYLDILTSNTTHIIIPLNI